MAFMLDTNIVSDLVRHPRGRVAQRIHEVGESTGCTSIIVLAEPRYGVVKRGSTRLRESLDAILRGLEVVPFETLADSANAQVREHLERTGEPIGSNDLLVAAHAVSLGHTIVTANEREFARVPGLAVVNWLASGE